MSDTTPLRRSTRKRVPNKKYTEDAFEGLQIQLSDSEKESEGRETVAVPIAKDLKDKEDDEFAAEASAADSADDTSSNGDENEGLGKAPVPEEEDEPGAELFRPAIKTPRYQKKPPRPLKVRGQGDPKSRGLPQLVRSKTEIHHVRQMIGVDIADLELFKKGRDKWDADITLPTRDVNEEGYGGLSYPPGYGEQEREEESESSWGWYYEENGVETMNQWQNKSALKTEEGADYYPSRHHHHCFLMGPNKSLKYFESSPNDSIHLSEGWKHVDISAEPEELTEEDIRRDGWILNLGGRIRCMTWAPNQTGDSQYLAVSLLKHEPSHAPYHTAYDPTGPFKACIDIWSFSVDRRSGFGRMDPDKAPRLVHSVCNNWGAPRKLRWCPFARNSRKDEDQRPDHSIGLLAGVWSDGYARVLDVRIPKVHDEAHVYVLYKGAAFASKPPNSICTCVAWVSDSDLVAGCANGMIAVWDIGSAISELPQMPPSSVPSSESPETENTTPSPPPYLHVGLHEGYILDCTTSHPLHPHLLTTTAADGFSRLTSLLQPHIDTVVSSRMRLYTPVLSSHTLLRGIIVADDRDGARLQPLRRFFTSNIAARCTAQVTAIASGASHASVLLGAADGSVMVTNPLARLGGRSAYAQIQQRWFLHEWVPSKAPDSAKQKEAEEDLPAAGTSDSPAPTPVPDPAPEGAQQHQHQQLLPRAGISRVTESFVPGVLDTAGDNPEKKARIGAGQGDRVVWQTIYEEETAVTAVEWNPNPACGSWAAAGLGSGLLRVEDLAI